MTGPVAPSEPPVLVEIRGNVGWLTLNRPAARNALAPDVVDGLLAGVIGCAANPAVRCVVLTGAGGYFCVGGDVDLFARLGDRAETTVGALADTFHETVRLLATMSKPLVTAINGPAAGAGLSLAILGDIAIAAESAKFVAAFSAVGLTPDGGASWLLPRLVGLRRAQEMILTNRRVGAEEAAAIGLVSRSVPDDDLACIAAEVASELAAASVEALGACRSLLHVGATNSLEAQLREESKRLTAAINSPAGRAGVAAYIEKRRPSFPGSAAVWDGEG